MNDLSRCQREYDTRNALPLSYKTGQTECRPVDRISSNKVFSYGAIWVSTLRQTLRTIPWSHTIAV